MEKEYETVVYSSRGEGIDIIRELDYFKMSTNKLHNPDKPAYREYYDLIYKKQLKRIEYHIYGKKHRENGPAVIEWSINGEVIKEEYWLNGKRLNELQIAVLKGDDNKNE